MLMILSQCMAHHVVIENFYFQSNSKFIGNFTSSITTNQNGDPLVNVKFSLNVQISREFVSYFKKCISLCFFKTFKSILSLH